MNFECCYIAGRCDHPECGSYPFGDGRSDAEPTAEDYCAAQGHAYCADEFDPATIPAEYRDTVGRCYCGEVRYPPGGPAPTEETPQP